MLQAIGAIAAIITAISIVWVLISEKLDHSKSYVCQSGHRSYGKKIAYCHQCGIKVSEVPKLYCPSGHEVEESFDFCPKCGKKVVKKASRAA